ncbi:long-chain fatty acid--CoA ligase [Nonomuraea sp. NPDC050556]|uniref:long-chain fatty acid--CoA ligase n=1 Tax=Nonomuraea sp. NPDC050556 TaxID=3364369 RepID=UPI00378A2FB5
MSPDKVALTYEGVDVTFAELAERVNEQAVRLREQGVRPGDRVAYLGQNHPAAVETLFAAALAGAVYLPLNARLTRAELDHILADATPSALVTGPGYEDLDLPAVERGVKPPDDVCLIMYTSGTTGRPKGAMLTHANLTWNVFNHLIDIDLRGDDVVLVTAPLFHIAALAQSFLPAFIKGARSVILPAFDADRVLETVERERVTAMFGVPAMFSFIAQSPHWAGADLTSLRLLECGGAPVPEPLIHAYQARGLTFLQGYGMTEAAPGVLYLGAEDSVRKAGTAGVPAFFTDVTLDEGEILVRGPNVFAGYWGQPPHEGWFRSGDLAERDDEGFYRVVGRVKDMIISGGENIYPAEVESALLTHPDIVDCAVVGVPDDRWGEVGKAFLVARRPVEPAEVLAHLDGRLARYKIPKYVEFVAELPRTASGKITKWKLT